MLRAKVAWPRAASHYSSKTLTFVHVQYFYHLQIICQQENVRIESLDWRSFWFSVYLENTTESTSLVKESCWFFSAPFIIWSLFVRFDCDLKDIFIFVNCLILSSTCLSTGIVKTFINIIRVFLSIIDLYLKLSIKKIKVSLLLSTENQKV